MAKLPNIIEKDRSLWDVLKFVVRESLNGSKKYTVIRFIIAVLKAIFLFAEFGAVAIIVNEFTLYGIAEARSEKIVYGLILLGVSHLVPEVLAIIDSYSWNTQINDLSRHLQSLIFKQMDDVDIGTIEQPEFQNIFDLSNRRGWRSFYSINNTTIDTVRHVTGLIISFIALMVITPIGALIIFLGALPTYFVERKNSILSSKVHKEESESWRAWTIKTTPLTDKHELTELKNFKLVEIFRKKFLEVIEVIHRKIKLVNKKYFFNDIVSQSALSITFIIAIIILIQDVYTGVLSVGLLVFAISTLIRFQTSMNVSFSLVGKMVEDKKNVNIFMDLLEMEPLVKSGTREIAPEDFKSLEIKNVSFAYPGSKKPVIHNMSLSINHTDSLAIVGLNGAGKTTLIKLLTRVYDPTKGKILVNGIDLKEYDLKAWKKCLGILLQDYTIYSEETITENIMLGDTSKHDQQLVEASAKETTADIFIQELPNKYQQRVGTEFQGGVELSKGQKQKLALARVLYRDAPIIILDEPTAAIDALSEDYIFKALRNNHKHQTRVIISHKFSNVRDADKIILIEHGKIIEQGSHDELMAIETGKYKELFNLQAEGYQDKPKRKRISKKKETEVSDEIAH
jgi:ATP-binding cassette subfamily B protein